MLTKGSSTENRHCKVKYYAKKGVKDKQKHVILHDHHVSHTKLVHAPGQPINYWNRTGRSISDSRLSLLLD